VQLPFGAVGYRLNFFSAFHGALAIALTERIGSLYLARKGFWESAAMLGVLAALSPGGSPGFVGIIVAAMLLIEWWLQRRQRPAEMRPPLGALLAGCAVPLGTGAYMFYLNYRFGDPLAFVHASAARAREPQSPLILLSDLLITPAEGWGRAIFAGRLPLDNWIDLFCVLLFIGLGVVLLYQRRWSEGALVVIGALLPLSSGLLMSQRRYMWVLFPVFILLARWGANRWVDRAITTVSLLGLGLCTALFANWYWVG
jgi:hypothetical protein